MQSLPTKPEDFAPEHVPNLSFGRIPEPIARLEKLASSFFERKPGVLIVRGFSTIKKIVDVGPAQLALVSLPAHTPQAPIGANDIWPLWGRFDENLGRVFSVWEVWG